MAQDIPTSEPQPDVPLPAMGSKWLRLRLGCYGLFFVIQLVWPTGDDMPELVDMPIGFAVFVLLMLTGSGWFFPWVAAMMTWPLGRRAQARFPGHGDAPLGSPLQTWHFLASVHVAGGLGGLLGAIVAGPSAAVFAGVQLWIGGTTLVGVRWAARRLAKQERQEAQERLEAREAGSDPAPRRHNPFAGPQFPPGLVKVGGWMLIVSGAMPVLVAGMLIVRGIAFEVSGKPAIATVVGFEESRSSDSTCHFPVLEFEAGQTKVESSGLTCERSPSFVLGERVDIDYLESSPRNFRLRGDFDYSGIGLLFVFVAVMVGPGVLIVRSKR